MNDNDGGARYVVRCLAFVVVQAVMRARGNAGRAELVFKATAFRLSAFKVFWGCFGADSYILETGKAECPPFYRARGMCRQR